MRHILRNCLFLFTSSIMVFGPTMQVQAQPKVKGTDLVCNGESFFQASNICSELSRLAKADGVLAQGENFKQIAVSGAPIASILNFYKNCNPKPTYLVSDGAGIDLMSGNCSDVNCSKIQSCKNTLLQYLAEMKKGGTKKLLWMIYPDPQGGNWATLKKNQDLWAQVVPEVMATIDTPEVYVVDLRPVWAGHYSQYTSDGIHATSAGGTATAEAFWKAMKADDWAFFNLSSKDTTEDTIPTSTRESFKTASATTPAILSRFLGNQQVTVFLSVDQPSNITISLTSVSGRRVLTAKKQVTRSGSHTVIFPVGALAGGIYCCEVRAGRMATQSTLLVP